jgi:hypothetical protein
MIIRPRCGQPCARPAPQQTSMRPPAPSSQTVCPTSAPGKRPCRTQTGRTGWHSGGVARTSACVRAMQRHGSKADSTAMHVLDAPGSGSSWSNSPGGSSPQAWHWHWMSATVRARGLVLSRSILHEHAPEISSRPDLGHDARTGPKHAGGLQPLPGRLSGGTLLVRVEEDSGAVLIAAVHKLPVRVRRVATPPEGVQQLVIRHAGGVVEHLHRLQVARQAAAHLQVGRPRNLAAGVAAGCGQHAVQDVKRGLHAPEAAARKGGHLLAWARLRERRIGVGVLVQATPQVLDQLLGNRQREGHSEGAKQQASPGTATTSRGGGGGGDNCSRAAPRTCNGVEVVAVPCNNCGGRRRPSVCVAHRPSRLTC